MQPIQLNAFGGYNMWVFRQGLKRSLNCGSSQALSRFPHVMCSPALSCLQVRQSSPHMLDFLGKAATLARRYPCYNLARVMVLTAGGSMPCVILAWLSQCDLYLCQSHIPSSVKVWKLCLLKTLFLWITPTCVSMAIEMKIYWQLVVRQQMTALSTRFQPLTFK